MTNPQCIHIPDGSVVVSGELFDMACAAIAERDKLLAEIAQLDTDACGERAERESWKHNFKNFHRLLCERFGYGHDEKDWLRDQLSLIEWIANRPRNEPCDGLICENAKEDDAEHMQPLNSAICLGCWNKLVAEVIELRRKVNAVKSYPQQATSPGGPRLASNHDPSNLALNERDPKDGA